MIRVPAEALFIIQPRPGRLGSWELVRASVSLTGKKAVEVACALLTNTTITVRWTLNGEEWEGKAYVFEVTEKTGTKEFLLTLKGTGEIKCLNPKTE